MGLGKVEKTITAEDTYTEWISVHKMFNVSISGISGDAVYLQKTFDGGTTIKDVASFTADLEAQWEEPEWGVQYRLGVKTGGYGAGTILCRISQ